MPNSYGEWQEQPDFREPPLALDGAADHFNHREDDDDYYTQPGELFRLMSPSQQKVLFENTARAMGDAPREIKIRHIGNCLKADPAYGEGVASALGIPTKIANVPIVIPLSAITVNITIKLYHAIFCALFISISFQRSQLDLP